MAERREVEMVWMREEVMVGLAGADSTGGEAKDSSFCGGVRYSSQ